MNATYDLVKPYINKSELHYLLFMGKTTGPNYKIRTHPVYSITSLCYIKEPMLTLKFNKSVYDINVSNIFESISLNFMGLLINRLSYDQIIIYQNKYNIFPLKIEDTILFPLPFECMLNDKGIIVSNNHQMTFEFIFSDNEDNNLITDIELNIDYSEIDKNYNTNKLINLTDAIRLECDSEKHNVMIICEDNFIGKQCAGYDEIKPNKTILEFELYYNINTDYLFFGVKDGVDFYKLKWFENCAIKINNEKFLEHRYEYIIENKQDFLPEGVLYFPQINKVDFRSSNRIFIIFYGVCLPTCKKNFKFISFT